LPTVASTVFTTIVFASTVTVSATAATSNFTLTVAGVFTRSVTCVVVDLNPWRSAFNSYAPGGTSENWYTPTWTGTLTYNYVSKLVRRCSSGRGAHCVTNYIPVWASGSGALTTPQPPPPPPPPPPPVVTTIAIASGVCYTNVICGLVPATEDVITGATLDLANSQIGIGNADGSSLTGTVDSWNVTPIDEEADTYALSAQGTLYNADGSLFGTFDVALSATADDSGNLTITSGTLTETQ